MTITAIWPTGKTAFQWKLSSSSRLVSLVTPYLICYWQVPVSDGSVEFKQTLEFDIAVCDLPRMSRLCLALYSSKSGKKPNQKKVTVKPNNKVENVQWGVISVCIWRHFLYPKNNMYCPCRLRVDQYIIGFFLRPKYWSRQRAAMVISLAPHTWLLENWLSVL